MGNRVCPNKKRKEREMKIEKHNNETLLLEYKGNIILLYNSRRLTSQTSSVKPQKNLLKFTIVCFVLLNIFESNLTEDTRLTR
jgi:hypothetical protein